MPVCSIVRRPRAPGPPEALSHSFPIWKSRLTRCSMMRGLQAKGNVHPLLAKFFQLAVSKVCKPCEKIFLRSVVLDELRISALSSLASAAADVGDLLFFEFTIRYEKQIPRSAMRLVII